jgi:hypothetical protein
VLVVGANAGGGGATDAASGLVRDRFELWSESASCELLLDSSSRFRLEEEVWGVGDALREAGGEGGKVAGRGFVTGPRI